MGVTKTTIKNGDGPQPKNGQTVVIEYTGWLKDTTKDQNKGNKYEFDSSVGRGDFEVKIGVGQVIRGEYQAVNQLRAKR
ncbi:FKBP-type peptidyl-prolyl cis-trans isomerase domain-containing protein [Cordyceps javanica]|uniref:peptidylprolyl isomerase n=1 Tax=Cordyceps javanica TaxID=43265 RepID=A0A545UPR7_9HYPO|nr:FKBP-type peptidyl-prolyl cis-trans isomerase domain-containing protein [Cordyceps javanica]